MNPLLSTPKQVTWLLNGQTSKDEPVRSFRVDRSPVSVGRRGTCDFCIPCPSVSGSHAELTLQEDRLFVRDIGSTNGTFVNGVRITGTCQLNHGDLLQFAQTVFRVSIEKHHTSFRTVEGDAADRALALIQFDKLISDRAITPHYQPIIDIGTREVLGYELLGRSRLFGLGTPAAMFSAAAVLNMEEELSRVMRMEGAKQACELPGDTLLFVNTHPSELLEPELLIFSLRELRETVPNQKLVLEIHEAAVTELKVMKSLRSVLRDLDIGLAYDDFGAGQARLMELTEVSPEFLKFDMCLIRDIHKATPERQRVLGSLVNMVCDLGIEPLAEGIESEQEHRVCCELGFSHAQGYLYGRPEVPSAFAKQALT